MRQCGGLLERQAVGDQGERPLRRTGVLGERARAERIQVGEHAVARLEPGHARPDGVDDAGHVDADALEPRRAQAGRRPGDRGHAVQEVEVDPVGRRSDDPDDDDIAAGNRPFDIADLDDAGRTVAIANRRPHSPARWPIVTTTLPLAWPSSTQRSASTTSSSG